MYLICGTARPVTVSVKLDNANHLLITLGRTGRLAFDFNLAASNTVDLAAATVTVSPTLVASVVAALPANTMVATFGTLQKDTMAFTAVLVLAGTSLENPA
jgi:hypothetical protein